MKHLIDCAMGREECDLVIKNVRVFNVFTGRCERGDVAVADGRIVALGRSFRAKKCYEGRGKYLLPGFIDAHIHIESSMLSPEAWASLAVPRGTTGIVADPHELVNVCGIAGAEYVKEAFSRLRCGDVSPLDVYLQLPSCVPATPFETSGAVLDGDVTVKELGRDLFFGLGEMMNFPAVLAADGDVLKKIGGALALGKPVDGHAPTLSGNELAAYRCAGVLTDHESVSKEECAEKIARGMVVQIRCGSSTNNLEDAAAVIDSYNFRRFVLCSDDKNAKDLSERGHLDDALARLVAAGVPAKYAIPMATINIAQCYQIPDVGAIAPRYIADMVLTDDLKHFHVCAVFKRGVLVAEDGKACFDTRSRYLPEAVRSTVRIKPVTADSFRIRCRGGRLRVIDVMPHGLYTAEGFVDAPVGELDVAGSDLLKLAVVERHRATGNIGLGILRGFGLKGGAIGISVAHDSHNLVILGDSDEAMARAVSELERMGGGMTVVTKEGAESFPLEIAGLMSGAPAEEVVARTGALQERARALGVKACYEPFMTLVFLSLAVIPKLKVTDMGLFDLDKFAFVPLEEV